MSKVAQSPLHFAFPYGTLSDVSTVHPSVAAKYDDDGVDIHFLNSDKSLLDCTSSVAVKQLFDSIEPEGLTPMGTKIEMLLLEYMDEIERYKAKKSGKEPKKRNYVCITDGAATDDPESVIVACARRLDEGRFPLAQIGIQFVQVRIIFSTISSSHMESGTLNHVSLPL